MFGDPVVATALLDRLLHPAVVVQIEGSSYRMRLIGAGDEQRGFAWIGQLVPLVYNRLDGIR